LVSDEGRGKRRYAPVSCTQALTRRPPNATSHIRLYGWDLFEIGNLLKRSIIISGGKENNM